MGLTLGLTLPAATVVAPRKADPSGGWTRLTDKVATALNVATDREYLYATNTFPKKWYRSPKTKLAWSWSAGQELTGSYVWFDGSQSGAFVCNGSANEKPNFGVSCSSGPGNTAKCIPAFDKDPVAGTATVCQDTPNAFGGQVCQQGVEIWVR